MRIVFCGSGSFAVPALEAILASGHEVAEIVTQPARPAGRGGKLRPTPLAEAARAIGLESVECLDVNSDEVAAAIAGAAPDVICVADFGQLVRPRVRQLARVDAINLHASLLPELRGAAPINWAVIRGYPRTGVTTFSLVDRMDAGPIYLQIATDIRPDETADELRNRLAVIGADALTRTLDLMEAGRPGGQEQDESRSTLARRLKKTDGLIDWSADVWTIYNLIRGTWPWPAGQTLFRRGDGCEFPVEIARAAVQDDAAAAGEPGMLDENLCVWAGLGRLQVVEIQPAGKRRMSWLDFVNGYRPRPGDRFVSMGR